MVLNHCKSEILVGGLRSTHESFGESGLELGCPLHPLIGSYSSQGTKAPDGLLLMTPARPYRLSSLYTFIAPMANIPRLHHHHHYYHHHHPYLKRVGDVWNDVVFINADGKNLYMGDFFHD